MSSCDGKLGTLQSVFVVAGGQCCPLHDSIHLPNRLVTLKNRHFESVYGCLLYVCSCCHRGSIIPPTTACLSVMCLKSVLRTERKPKIGRIEAHHTSNPWTYLEVKISKVKVTRTINAVTKSVISSNRKSYKLQTWYTNGARRPILLKSTMTSKVKVAMSCDASDRCWPISQEQKVPKTPQFVWRLPNPRAIMLTSFNVKSSKVNVTRQINAGITNATWLMWDVQQMAPWLGAYLVCDTACFASSLIAEVFVSLHVV